MNTQANSTGQKIAVIGGGISGNTAAHILSRAHDVTIYERNDYLGGHTNTRMVATGSEGLALAVDTGFIVCNPTNYPNFYRLLKQLGVALQDSEMSFGYSSEIDTVRYLGPSFKEFMRLPSTLLSPRLVTLFFEQRSFGKRVIRDLERGALEEVPLKLYLDRMNISPFFRERYLYPLIGSIWSSPDIAIQDFPAKTFAVFFRNHGMLDLSKRPQWQTVVGGSHTYVKKFQNTFRGRIHLGCAVQRVERDEHGVSIVTRESQKRYDAVVLAVHADQALQLLSDAATEEREALGSWRYAKNRTVLHSDISVLPGKPRSWASWNYVQRASGGEAPSASEVQISYYMNRLQSLKARQHFLVTLNSPSSIASKHVHYEVDYEHPVYTADSVKAQDRLRSLNGQRRTYFAGAHLGYGFHEDGVNSALDVARHFGMEL